MAVLQVGAIPANSLQYMDFSFNHIGGKARTRIDINFCAGGQNNNIAFRWLP
jgi:hypothetical protein